MQEMKQIFFIDRTSSFKHRKNFSHHAIDCFEPKISKNYYLTKAIPWTGHCYLLFIILPSLQPRDSIFIKC